MERGFARADITCMSMFAVGGLATGLDTKSIVDQLMQIESRPRQQLEWKAQLWTARKAAWSDLNTKLLAVQGAANALTTPTAWDASAGQDAWVDATKARVKSFVDAYNATLDLVHQKTQVEQRVSNPDTLAKYLQGPLAHDVQYSRVAFDLRRAATDPVTGLPADSNVLAQVGITSTFAIGATGAQGRLEIDDAKLDAALRADPAAVRELFAKVGADAAPGADDGIMRRVSELVSQLRTGGSVDSALDGAGDRIRMIQRSIDATSDRLERRRAGYERMFASLEATIGKLQSQGAWLSGQFASLSGG